MSVKDATEVHDIIIEDTIDSRDLIDLRATLISWQEDRENDPDFEADEYEPEDVAALLAAIQEFEDVGAPDWNYGAQFIRDTYFEDYARELAEDIGAVPADYSWPASHIDWEDATEALRQDYMSVTIEGATYWTHA